MLKWMHSSSQQMLTTLGSQLRKKASSGLVIDKSISIVSAGHSVDAETGRCSLGIVDNDPIYRGQQVFDGIDLDVAGVSGDLAG